MGLDVRSFIERYAAGPAKLRAAFEAVPEEARRWRPSEDAFSAHEVVVHCADSETKAHGRIRQIAAEESPTIQGYDEVRWARALDYHAHPAELALATVEAVRANTVPLLERLPAAVWERAGRHTQSGRYTAADWLRNYASHLEEHAAQVEVVHAAWKASPDG